MKKTFFCFLWFIILFHINTASLFGAELDKKLINGSEFYFGPEDVLEISVWKNEDLTKTVVVRPDGKISFPLIGDVLAQGLTVDELRRVVEDKVKVLIPDMPVAIIVTQVMSRKVYVVGKVETPGVYLMGKTLRVMQILGMAGGLTPFAKKKNIIILRKNDGHQKTFRFNYSKVAAGKDLDQNICLQPGDTIVVP